MLFLQVRLAAHVSNGWKSLIHPCSGKDTVKTKGVLSNIMLNELDKELERRGHRFVCYADDCMLFAKAEKVQKEP